MKVASLYKPRFSLLPPLPLAEVVRVLEYGAKKHGAGDYLAGNPDPRMWVDALLRHSFAYLSGQQTDPESTRHHLACVAAEALIIMDIEQNRGLITLAPIYAEEK